MHIHTHTDAPKYNHIKRQGRKEVAVTCRVPSFFFTLFCVFPAVDPLSPCRLFFPLPLHLDLSGSVSLLLQTPKIATCLPLSDSFISSPCSLFPPSSSCSLFSPFRSCSHPPISFSDSVLFLYSPSASSSFSSSSFFFSPLPPPHHHLLILSPPPSLFVLQPLTHRPGWRSCSSSAFDPRMKRSP